MVDIVRPPTFSQVITDGGRPLKIFIDFLTSLFNRSPQLGNVILTPGSTTTVVEDVRVTTDSKIFLSPTSSTSGTITYITKARGGFTLNHASTAATDKTFDYVLFN